MDEAAVIISFSPQLEEREKEAILALWNNEYPAQLRYPDMSGLDAYLDNLSNPKHYFAKKENQMAGWAFSFTREEDTWFAIIVDLAYQGGKLGTSLLSALKQHETILNGWVTDHDRYVKADGSSYRSPLAFYQKMVFKF